MEISPDLIKSIYRLTAFFVRKYNFPQDLAEDAANSLMVEILAGELDRVDTIAIKRYCIRWFLRWFGTVIWQTKEEASRIVRASLPPNPINLIALQEVWNNATSAEKLAITDLLIHGKGKTGPSQHKNLDKREQADIRRHLDRIKRLRQNLIGGRPFRGKKKHNVPRQPVFAIRIPVAMLDQLNPLAKSLVGDPRLAEIGYAGKDDPLPISVVARLILNIGLKVFDQQTKKGT